MVEIAKALAVEANLLILDEPTALGQEEADELFSVMRQLKSEGVTIIFISHKLEEIKEIGDRLTVLRDGKKIITTDVDSLSIDEIITYMVGRQIDDKYPKVKSKRGELALEVRNLSTPELLQDISFKAYRGEVLGIAGLVGAGRTERQSHHRSRSTSARGNPDQRPQGRDSLAEGCGTARVGPPHGRPEEPRVGTQQYGAV